MTRTIQNMFRRLHRRDRDRLAAAIEHRPPSFEGLETRQMLSATLVGDVLTIDGTAVNDAIRISAGAANGDVVVNFAPGVARNTTFNGVNSIVINGLAGNDRIAVRDGIVDTLGAAIGVQINAGDGNDRVRGGSGDEVIDAGAGNDRVRDDAGDNTVDLGDGFNRVRTGDGNDDITGGADQDRIRDTGGTNTIDAGDGNNRIRTGDGDDDITTGTGLDRIRDTGGTNTIDAGDGDNRVRTSDGDDTITTGAGDDRVRTGDGTNAVFAGTGADRISTGDGDDTVDVDDEGDRITSSGGTDSVDVDAHATATDLGTIGLGMNQNLAGNLTGADDEVVYSFTLAGMELTDMSLTFDGGVAFQLVLEDADDNVIQTVTTAEGFNAQALPAGTYFVELTADVATAWTLAINFII